MPLATTLRAVPRRQNPAMVRPRGRTRGRLHFELWIGRRGQGAHRFAPAHEGQARDLRVRRVDAAHAAPLPDAGTGGWAWQPVTDPTSAPSSRAPARPR